MTIDLARTATAPFEPIPEHTRFATFAGEWSGKTSTWFEPGTPAEETTTTACFEAILGGRFLRVQYTGTVMGKPHAGEMLLAFEKDTKEYTMAMADSFHTGTALMISKGTPSDDGSISVLGSYVAGPERWGWRTVLRATPQGLVIEAFNITPAGEESLAIRTELARS